MITIKKFVFNPFQENTYLLYDETGKSIIIDPGCYEQSEKDHLVEFINSKQLSLDRLLYTHCHVDHVLGNNFISETFDLKPEIHKAGLPFLISAHETGQGYGFSMEKNIQPEKYFDHGDIISFGESQLKVVYTPGHADGSVCFINSPQKFVITGDVLFRDSIGRTDFPTGDFDILMQSIHSELFTLDDDYTVYCGHGPETTIGYEKVNNPFIRF